MDPFLFLRSPLNLISLLDWPLLVAPLSSRSDSSPLVAPLSPPFRLTRPFLVGANLPLAREHVGLACVIGGILLLINPAL